MSAFIIAIVICIIAALCTTARGYSIDVKAGERRCFFLSANKGVSCSGSFEVISPDPKPIYVEVRSPAPLNGLIYESKFDPVKADKDISEGSFQFDTEYDGDYKMCIANNDDETGDGLMRTVAFNFRAVASGLEDYEYSTLQTELLSLRQGLDFLKDHQAYMNQREDVHRETLDNINMKVLCWTVLEAAILLGMTFWQITYIQGFFETKRKI